MHWIIQLDNYISRKNIICIINYQSLITTHQLSLTPLQEHVNRYVIASAIYGLFALPPLLSVIVHAFRDVGVARRNRRRRGLSDKQWQEMEVKRGISSENIEC